MFAGKSTPHRALAELATESFDLLLEKIDGVLRQLKVKLDLRCLLYVSVMYVQCRCVLVRVCWCVFVGACLRCLSAVLFLRNPLSLPRHVQPLILEGMALLPDDMRMDSVFSELVHGHLHEFFLWFCT